MRVYFWLAGCGGGGMGGVLPPYCISSFIVTCISVPAKLTNADGRPRQRREGDAPKSVHAKRLQAIPEYARRWVGWWMDGCVFLVMGKTVGACCHPFWCLSVRLK